MSQSSASLAVQSLEERLGTVLIDRSQRPWDLTPAGRVYYDGCRKLLENYRRLEDQVRRTCDHVAGRVRVAAIYSVGLLQMDAYVRRYQEMYPDVDLQLDYLHPDDVYSRVLSDQADLGLVSFPKDGGEIGCIPWLEQEMVLVVPPGHPVADLVETSPDAINGERFIGFTPELKIRRKIDRWLRDQKIHVDVVHEFDNVENIKRAVEIGSGVAVLPDAAVRREVEAGSLCTATFNEHNWHRPLGIVHKRHKTFTAAVDKFVELLHESEQSTAVDAEHAGPRNRKKRTANATNK